MGGWTANAANFKRGEKVEVKMTRNGRLWGWANGSIRKVPTEEKITVPTELFEIAYGPRIKFKNGNRHSKFAKYNGADILKIGKQEVHKDYDGAWTYDGLKKLVSDHNGKIKITVRTQYMVLVMTQELNIYNPEQDFGAAKSLCLPVDKLELRKQSPTMEALKEQVCNYKQGLKKCYLELLSLTKGFTDQEKKELSEEDSKEDFSGASKFKKFRCLRTKYKNLETKCLADHNRLLGLHAEKLRVEAIGNKLFKDNKVYWESLGNMVNLPEYDAICKEHMEEAEKGYTYDYEEYYLSTVRQLHGQVTFYERFWRKKAKDFMD